MLHLDLKKTLLILAFIVLFTLGYKPVSAASGGGEWGRTGHFITGQVAEKYLSPEAKAALERLLGETSLAVATVWMDEVRSREEYRYTADWHWVTVPDGQTYAEAEKNPNGDVIWALEDHIEKLKQGGLSEDEEREALRFVIHTVGDMHQPLHVGTGTDRGGNDVAVEWRGRESNLHRVWDTDMIESWNMTSTEMTEVINFITEETRQEWLSGGVRDWAAESVSYRENVYDIPEDAQLGWEYRNRSFHIVEKRLLQAGVRMAGLLNDIYGQS